MEKTKKQNILLLLFTITLVIIIMGSSYALFRFTANGTKENIITTGIINISYEGVSYINLENTYPKTDIYALTTKEDSSIMNFNISLESTSDVTINYVIGLTEITEGETLKNNNVKIYLEKNNVVVNTFEENTGKLISEFENKYVEGIMESYAVYQDVIIPTETVNYTLTAWIDENYKLPIKEETTNLKETNKETYKFKITIVGVDSPILIEEKSNITTGVNTIISKTDNLNDSRLYTITHSADSTLQIGATEDIIEYRYRGASPKNYVSFNNETWRIIGVFPTEDENGNIENRIKLIRNESIGDYYWNTTQVSSTNSYNNWTGATLNTYLNGDYYNTLTSEAQSMISSSKYYLGGYNAYTQTSVYMYSYERKISGSSYYYESNPTNWVGKLALMYESDYGYASANCETKKLYNSDSTQDLRACNDTNWLYKSLDEWLLPQDSYSSDNVFYVEGYGGVNYERDIFNTYAVRPVLYITSSVQITSGDGTESNPYQFSL